MALIHQKKYCRTCGKQFPQLSGENHWNWKKDRSTLAKKQERQDSAYIDWRYKVITRDKRKCQIADENCNGKSIVHHILSWSSFPELRYNINNGITLYQFHYPRKRIDETKLIPFFTELVMSNSN